MTRAQKALAIFVVASFGIWGCAQGPGSNSGSSERIKILQNKNAKLEDDLRAVAGTRDQLNTKVANLEAQLAQLRLLAKERDELQQQVKARIGERDALQLQFDQFRKSLRDLLGQAEVSASRGSEQPVTANVTANPGKS